MSEKVEKRTKTTSNHRILLCLGAVFAIVHFAYYFAGIRFYSDTMIHFMHFLDPELLKTRLLESTFYLHTQPPLYNLYLGLILKMPGDSSNYLFPISYLAMGFGLCVCLYKILIHMGIRRSIALTLTCIFMATPSFILYENWLFYTLPCALLVTLSVLFLFNALHTRLYRWWFSFFTILAILCGIRSMFHLIYLVFVVISLATICRDQRKTILKSALIPIVLLLSIYVKNYAVFDQFNVCSWSGKNVWIKSVGNMDWKERQKLVETGQLSYVSSIARYNELGYYDEKHMDPGKFSHIPALSKRFKSTDGINYNHIGYIEVSKLYGQDAIKGLLHSPKTFVLCTMQACLLYMKSTSDYEFAPPNRALLKSWISLCDTTLYGRLPININILGMKNYRPCLFILLGLPLVVAVGLIGIYTGRIGGRSATNTQRIVVGYIVFNILYVALMGNTFEMVETNRFRFMTEALIIVLFAISIEKLLNWHKKRRFSAENYDQDT